MPLAPVLGLVLLGVLGADGQTVVSKAVTFVNDGVTLRGTYYSAGARGPGLLLFHQCNRTSSSWRGLAAAAAARGINVLTFDYPGVGENRHLPNDYSKRGTDADAALAWLMAQPDIDAERVAAGGASCGVDLAAALASRHPQIGALLLMSGGANAEGMAYLRSGRVPVLFAFSADEGGPLPEMKATIAAAGHAGSAIRELHHAGHGVPMFDSDPTLLPGIVDWLVRTLH